MTHPCHFPMLKIFAEPKLVIWFHFHQEMKRPILWPMYSMPWITTANTFFGSVCVKVMNKMMVDTIGQMILHMIIHFSQVCYSSFEQYHIFPWIQFHEKFREIDLLIFRWPTRYPWWLRQLCHWSLDEFLLVWLGKQKLWNVASICLWSFGWRWGTHHSWTSNSTTFNTLSGKYTHTVLQT